MLTLKWPKRKGGYYCRTRIKRFGRIDPNILQSTYGLAGKQWTETLHDILRDMDLISSQADPCIWLRENPKLNLYEYIAV